MKLILENIGKIKKAEIDLDHQLTVFFGPNNTGKTYVSYCLYGLSRINPFVDLHGDLAESIDKLLQINFEDLYQTGIIEVDLIKTFLPQREALRYKYNEAFKESLPYLFGNYDVDFSKSAISLSFLTNDEEFTTFIKNIPVSSNFVGSPALIEIRNEGDGILFIKDIFGFSKLEDFDKYGIAKVAKEQLLQYLFNLGIANSIFIPSERTGISVFGKDVLRRRFEKSNAPNRKSELLPYSSVIETAILDQDSLDRMKPGKKEYILIAEKVEKEILEGGLSVNDSGEILYSNNEVKSLSIRSSASNIKSLSSLVFYLRYFAHEDQSLFIDEPEINLHPDNQIKIARVLAKIANLGIKVFVSTHSDYIIREFNSLMMLGKDDPEKERLMGEYGYKHDEILNYKSVGAYLFNDGLAKQIEVTPEGFDAETIDETINRQNKASNDIRWTLFES